ncbi:MAG: SCO family protein [Pseudomonadota bacterium]
MARPTLRKPAIIFVTAFIVCIAGWGAWRAVTWFTQREPAPMDTGAMRGVIIASPALALPAFQLTDGNNRAYTNEQLKNHWTLIYFGYTHCPDICPTTLQTLAKVTAQLSDTQRNDTQVLFISLDPKRDSSAIIKDYVAHFDASFTAASAPATALHVLTEPLGVIYEFEGDTNKPDYTLNHYGAVFIMDPQARLRAYILPPHEAPRVLEAYTKIRVYYGGHS